MSKSSQSVIVDYTQGNLTSQLLKFATPLFLSNLLQVLYNMVDMVVVGQFAGTAGLSAVSIGGDISTFLTFLAMGFSNAGQVIISQYVGAGQHKEIGKFVGTMFTFMLSLALCLSVLGLIFQHQLLAVMNTPAESWTAAMYYSGTCMVGLVFIYGYNIVSAILRGLGDSKHPFIFVGTAALLNIVLDLILVAGFGMGAFGAGLATVIGQTVSFLFSVVFLVKRHNSLGIDINRRCFRINWDMLSTLIKLGVPMAIKNASVTISKMFVNSWINSYGVVVSAVSGILNKFNTIFNLFSNSFNAAGSSMVGQNIGAQKYSRVMKVVVNVFVVTGVFMVLLTVCILVFPRPIFRIFTSEEDVLAICMTTLPVLVITAASCLARSGANALINGSGNYKVNFVVAIMDGIVKRIGLSLLLGLALNGGYMGFWYGGAYASFTPFVVFIFYAISGSWKTRKYVIKEK